MAVIYLCPVDKRLLCSWEGYASDIKQHFEKEHNGLLFHTNSIEIDLNILHENRLMFLEEEAYLIQSFIENGKLFLRMRYLGSTDAASRLQYDVTITINNFSYKYEAGRNFCCITPTAEGWEISLEQLERLHGRLNSLTCTVLIENRLEDDLEIKRRGSEISLRINNSFIEKNVVDETEAKFLDAMQKADERLRDLKNEKYIVDMLEQLNQEALLLTEEIQDKDVQHQRDSGDIMDKISNLNLSILEEPFKPSLEEPVKPSPEEPKSDHFTEILPDIPEELNLSCSSCTLDMLPPIYLCMSGHSVCSWCKSNPCKICNGAITVARNTDLENISRTHKHQCRYFSDGCNEKLLYNEVRSHEARCNFCKYKCPIDCPYEGRYQAFLNHLKIVHSSVKISYNIRNDFPKNTQFYIASHSKGIFYCKSEQNTEAITWTAIFCGPKERQFFCELTFKGSKFKEPIFLKRRQNIYEVIKTISEMKKMKAKDKYAILSIMSYDN